MAREMYLRLFGSIGMALREPEEFAERWQREQADYRLGVWMALGLTAAAGTFFYGMTLGMGHGVAAVLSKARLLTASAGLAWAIPLPALYILNSFAGSRLRLSTTLLAALVTTSWGGLAMLASVPIGWFFAVALPDLPAISPQISGRILMGVNALVMVGVSVSMCDVFGRVMERLEPAGGKRPMWYLGLVGLIGLQLCYLFGLLAL